LLDRPWEDKKMVIAVVGKRTSYLRALLAGAVVALLLANGLPARAQTGTGSPLVAGTVLKAEKGTVDQLCALNGEACTFDGVAFIALHSLQVVRTGPLEQNFHANGVGFGGFFSLEADGSPFDQLCWSGDAGSGDTLECVKISHGNPTGNLSCPVIQVSRNDTFCDTTAAEFTPPPEPLDYVVSWDQNDSGGPIEVTTCGTNVVAQCFTSADLAEIDAVGLAQASVGGYDYARSSGGTRYAP
jgi:hypothetical protein